MLFNSTTKEKIIGKVRLARDAPSRGKGLMFEKKANFDYALVFELPHETRLGASVHMMFVAFPIDIVFLDQEKRVLEKATLMPWMLNYTPKKPARYFVELPEGLGGKIKKGDELEWGES